MKKIIVSTTTKNYPVFFGSDIINSLPELTEKYKLSDRVFFIIDRKVEIVYSQLIKKIFKTISGKKHFLTLPSSERIKSFRKVQDLLTVMTKEDFARDTLIIAIGGGTIGDVAGFVASTYMRGVQLVHIPTTLLSAVDSSVGGKTGINFKNAKNLIGTFYQPSMVLIETNFFKSLPHKEIISGLGEVIKYSYITDGKLYSDLLTQSDQILKKNSDYLLKAVYECIKIKSAIVSQDEHDITGVRKILNFGHTFAHAFESNSSYRLSHGKSVMAGIVSALFLSFKKGIINKQKLDYMIKLPLKFKSSIRLKNFDEEKIIRLMKFDKKRRVGATKFVLVKNFGEVLIDINADNKEIYWALNNTRRIMV